MLDERHVAIIQSAVNVVIQNDPATSDEFLGELESAIDFALIANEAAAKLGETPLPAVASGTGVSLSAVKSFFDGSREISLSQIQRIIRFVQSLPQPEVTDA